MIPQSNFMILAPVNPQREAELRRLLDSMNSAPGRLKPESTLIPFRQLATLHFAKLLILDDQTTEDIRLYGIPPRTYPRALALVCEIDGNADVFLAELARRAPEGLRTIFSCCEGFPAGGDLLAWMQAHNLKAAASYVNWRGRTVQRIREGASLYNALEQHIQTHAAELQGLAPREIHARLRQLTGADVAAGRLTLSPEPPTPLGWRIGNFLHAVGLPLLLLPFLPLLLIVSLIGVILVRRSEKTDPEFFPRPDPAAARELWLIEDHDVTNQFCAMGSLKPGLVRLLTMMAALGVIDYAARHWFTHGNLGRVRTIHFARWVLLDGRRRAIFFSNYDGSLESYMDDFINKVGFGLNVSFSAGIGYPRTRWLLCDGCNNEQKFKDYLRRHQLPTQVWYKAYPGLTAVDLERHDRIRKGLESSSMNDREAREWVALL